MTRTLKSIAPLQLGKILAIVYGLISLIFVPFFLIFAVIGAFVPQQSGNSAALAGSLVGVLFMMVLFPIMYAVMGFLTGVIGGWVYNIVAKWVGGIQVDIE